MTKQECVDILTKAGYKETSKHIWYMPGTYYLAHGEYEQPDIFIRHRKGGEWGIKIEYYYYNNTFNAKQDHFLTDEEIYELTLMGEVE